MSSTKISFNNWWMKLIKKRPEIKPHMKEIIWADFKARKLTEKEEPAKYDEAMKLFGW